MTMVEKQVFDLASQQTSERMKPSEFFSPRDWTVIKDVFRANEPLGHVIMDGFLCPEICSELRKQTLAHWGWYYKKPDAQELYLRNPDIPWLQWIGAEIVKRLPSIFHGMELVECWAFLHQRNAGLKVHSDNGALTLNLWVTPNDCNLESGGGGLVLSDIKRTSEMAVHEFGSPEAYFERHTKGGRIRIPYLYNRAVLFDARIFHYSDSFRFDTSSIAKSRINISLLFDDPKEYAERLSIYNSPANMKL